MTAKNTPRYSGDKLVETLLNYVSELRGDFVFGEKEVLLQFAVKMTMRSRVSTKMRDELIMKVVDALPLGVYRVLELAPRASVHVKELLLKHLLSPHHSKDNVERVIQYADDVIKRTLTQKELMRMKERLSCADNPSEREARKTLLVYAEKHYPELVDEFIEFFRKEDAFWNGVGSLI